jgi:sialate O-acetylesterase
MKKQLFTLFFSILILQNQSICQIRLPKLISDGMVLQRDKPLKIWGWASPKEKISIDFNKKTYKVITPETGKWEVTLSQYPAGGPFEMTLKGKNELKIKDIFIGDVWFCSGQSNMVHQMELHSVTYANDIAQANNSAIRHFGIPTTTNVNATNDDFNNGSWKVCNPENVRQFSAVAYFFAKKIYDKYQVPIGLINASVGGTPIEAWISEEGFKDFTKINETIAKNKDTAYVNSFNRRFNRPQKPAPIQDKSLNGTKTWFDISYEPKGWKTINIPGYWEDQGIKDLNGTVWYRKEIDVPASMIGKPARVFLGRIIDADMLYINGKQVGVTTYQYPQRRYQIPADLLKAGKNLFVIKVTNTAGKGGFVPDKPYYLFSEKDTVDLKGTWQYKVGEVFSPMQGGFGGGFSAQNQPTALYNAMVAPSINFAIKGFLWYQGETNSGKADEYLKLQPAQILDWRTKWNQGELPFLYVQLPNFMDANYLPSESQWAALRDAQLKSLSVPNTAMAVGIDVGEWNDIHPDNKKTVGERLALAAQKLAYQENITASGPLFQSATIEGNKIILSFTNVGGGLKTNDDEDLREFAIAGADKKFVWATAKIVGDKIEVSNTNIAAPLYVRYAWADNPNVNFYNKEGLPASPFKTGE